MRFGYSNSIRGRVVECTPELLSQALDNPATARVCAEIEDALEKVRRGEMSRDDFETLKAELKKQLPIITPHAMFKSGRRLNSDAVASGLSMYDIDHISDPRGFYEQRIAGREKELGIVMAHVTPSTEGLRLLFIVPQGMTLEEAQQWMSKQLDDDDYDGCVKDLARCSFLVPRSYVVYMDFGSESQIRSSGVQECRSSDNTLASNPSSLISHPSSNLRSEAVHPTPPPSEGLGEVHPSSLPQGGGQEGAVFKGIPYQDIIAEYWRCTGGQPQRGERNDRLHQLAANLRAICDNQEEWLLAIMPRYGLSEQEMRSIIHSACKEPTKGSRLMRQIVERMRNTPASYTYDTVCEEPPSQTSLPLAAMTKTLPIGLRESLVGVPATMHMPVLCGVLPLAAAYADQVEVEYCDGNRQHLGLMSIIRGDQASNKSVVKNAIDIWKRQLDEEDALARRREEEWKERKKGRKASEKAPDDPKVMIRMMPVTVSCSTLLRRLKNARDHTLYSFGEELDTLRKTNGAGSWSSKYDVYRLAFDRGEWGQDYNSDQAESGVAKVAYNWTMLGTNGALRKCFKTDNIENGLSSRILVAEMPDSAFSRMPKFGKRSADDEARIQEAVSRLRSYSGLIDVPRLRKAIEQWVEEKRVEAAKDIDHVKDTYRKRSAVIGFRCGVVYHLLTGKEKETKSCLSFALAMAEYCLEQQIKTFGEALQNQYVEASGEGMRKGKNKSVFDQLPPSFSLDDLAALKHDSVSRNSVVKIISRWKRDGWISKTANNRWKKTL